MSARTVQAPLVICAAEQYAGIYYEYGGGHQGYSTFKQGCPDPSKPQNNQPFGGPSNSGGLSGNPSPCGLDCSALVSVAVDDAFGGSYMWSVSSSGVMQDGGSGNWQSISIAQALPGDIVTQQDGTGHVEIVDHVSGNTIYTFGERSTGSVASRISQPLSGWTGGAYRWTVPGSGN